MRKFGPGEREPSRDKEAYLIAKHQSMRAGLTHSMFPLPLATRTRPITVSSIDLGQHISDSNIEKTSCEDTRVHGFVFYRVHRILDRQIIGKGTS